MAFTKTIKGGYEMAKFVKLLPEDSRKIRVVKSDMLFDDLELTLKKIGTSFAFGSKPQMLLFEFYDDGSLALFESTIDNILEREKDLFHNKATEPRTYRSGLFWAIPQEIGEKYL